MESESFIRVRDLKKIYPMDGISVHALAGVDLDVARGSLSVVMGPSGSGKSTLLYLLGGLDRPTAGSIQVGGAAIEALDENALALYRREKVGFIFQSFNLVASMTALENVSFPMYFAGVPPRRRKERGLELLRQVGLEKRAGHRPTELSGGQQQRVAIARALINDPPLVLADEPTGNLDTASGYSIMQLLAELNQGGRTIVVVTHDARMNRFASEMVRLLDGRIVAEDEYNAAVTLQSGGEA